MSWPVLYKYVAIIFMLELVVKLTFNMQIVEHII